MIIAVTLSDEVNMVACQVAHSLFNVPTKIARIRAQNYLAPEYADLFSREHMPIDVIISPEVETGKMVLRRIALPGAADAMRFANDAVAMVAIECLEDCPVINTPLEQLSELFPNLTATVVGLVRAGKLFVPHSTDQIETGDLAYVICDRTHVRRTLGLFGHEEPDAQRIVIAGGGNIGFYVAKMLEEHQPSIKVKIIEHDRERAVAAADGLRRAVVLNGSALDRQIQIEADVEDADLMVALTNDDQVNILSSVMAKRLGCKANLTLINNPDYQEFTKTVGIDAYINPRAVTISRILQHVRRGRIRAVYSVEKGEAEVIEAEAMDTSPLVGKPLRELDLPPGVRVGAIYRDKQVLQPSGDTKIKSRDRVVLFATAGNVRRVEQMFRVSLEFF
jgi:trk system potassium uptake protein TrkA